MIRKTENQEWHNDNNKNDENDNDTGYPFGMEHFQYRAAAKLARINPNAFKPSVTQALLAFNYNNDNHNNSAPNHASRPASFATTPAQVDTAQNSGNNICLA